MPKIVDHDQYRKEMMLQCRELFCKKGYANVSMREISRELNVSTGTLYHYFPTKQEIFEQIFFMEMTVDVEEVMSGIEDQDSVKDRLDKVIDHWVEKRNYYQNIVLLVVDFFRNQDRSVTRKVIGDYSGYYRKSMSEVMLLPYPLASSLFAYVVGLMYHDLILPDALNLREQLNSFRDMILSLPEKDGGYNSEVQGGADEF